MKIYIGIVILILFMICIKNNREKFKEYNSMDIPPTGIIKETDEKQPIVEKIKSLPTKKFVFQSDQFISPLTEEETRLMTSYLKRHFPNFLDIVRIKKEQQQKVKRYDIVFMIKDTHQNVYNHVVLTKIIVKDGRIFFNSLEYGGMVLPNEMPSKQKDDQLFFIHESPNKVTFLDNQIKNELDAFEKRKIEILLRRGRKAS